MNNSNTTVISPPQQINPTDVCDIVETRHNSGERVTVLHLSKELNVTQAKIRNILVQAYGTNVRFTRGRTGGIMLLESFRVPFLPPSTSVNG